MSAFSSHRSSSLAAPPSRGFIKFNLAVVDVEVSQVASTPMFRELEVRCEVQNRGPGTAPSRAFVVLSRPGEDGPKILRRVAVPPLASGEKLMVRTEGAVWFASAVPYRCAIEFDGAGGDADPSDDVAELTFPRL
jgi:hypothetical protein